MHKAILAVVLVLPFACLANGKQTKTETVVVEKRKTNRDAFWTGVAVGASLTYVGLRVYENYNKTKAVALVPTADGASLIYRARL